MKTKIISEEYIWKILEEVSDPEVPVLSVIDLGVVREIKLLDDGKWYIKITPTYTGCPATKVMEFDIKERIRKEGIEVAVETVLSPAWTTDWLSDEGREKLKDYGITPPQNEDNVAVLFGRSPDVPCPHCESIDTKQISKFGSTACKALYKCNHCLEPFEYFKCHR